MPLPRGGRILDYSRWQQNLIGILQPGMAYHSNLIVDHHIEITLDVRLAYQNKGDAENAWTEYSSAIEKRNLDCFSDQVNVKFYYLKRFYIFFILL